MSATEVYECPTCHHSSNKTWHLLTPGLVTSLIKLRTAVGKYNRNHVDIHNEMDLTTTEAMNWTKLRFHGLVAKYKVDGVVQRGQWLVTKKGSQFLRGELAVAHRVRTLNNHIIERGDVYVDIADVMKGELPRFEDLYSIKYERVPIDVDQMSFAL